ncbi:MAG: flagellar biosynthesis protein [Alkalibacterium sp.]|nr:flagellar biosynthesis protein [Alkalibacterium sp.]
MLQNLQGSQSVRPQSIKQPEQTERQIDPAFQSFMQDAIKETDQATAGVTFSHHAQKRLDQHGFTLNAKDMHLLEEAVDTLEAKGSKQSLILYDDLALIASIQNKTVITALKSTEMNDVTNIDSAIQINGKR